MKKNPFRIAKLVCLGILAALLVAMVVVMVVGYIGTANNPYTSFPAYAAIVFTALYFALPILIVLLLVILFAVLEKRKK
ncbi:MAG: hypothetical protein ACK5LX_00415 [Oscillospiraceae bacterium]